MVNKKITTIEDLVKILEIMIDEKSGVTGYSDDAFEISKSEKAFLIKSKENATTTEIPHSNCFSIEENVKRFEYALSCIGITKGEVDKPKEENMKLSKLQFNLQLIEAKNFCESPKEWSKFDDYSLRIRGNEKEYEIFIPSTHTHITIPRMYGEGIKGGASSVLRSKDKLVEKGFIDDLEKPTITHSELIKTQPQPIFDNVNHPKHYTQGKIECIEAMKAMLTKEEFRGFLRGSIFKYQWRVMDKNGIEDLEKAQWYLNYLIKELRELDKE